ncbi:hypothetical protein AVEN_144806-1 [Araneus ventricosus]|uniref:Uncharacterized protein n=1 Tax=Araneus ventricosus TaxID=182803 RepID=A0A4Y2MXU9_ARAVE|nr:hypothetical protein AVEN_144806-1 [Araneus ventricosus]
MRSSNTSPGVFPSDGKRFLLKPGKLGSPRNRLTSRDGLTARGKGEGQGGLKSFPVCQSSPIPLPSPISQEDGCKIQMFVFR